MIMTNRTRYVFCALVALAWHDASAQTTEADLRAAGIPGMQFLDTRLTDQRLSVLGIRVIYLEADASLGTTGKYFCGALTPDQAAAAAGPVSSGIARLPQTTVTRMGLRYLILCSVLTKDGRRIGGIPVPPLDLLMLKVGSAAQAGWLEGSALHELYHMAEYRINALADGDWERQFTGYANAYAPNLGSIEIGSGAAGFLDSYSQTFPYEERAELFSHLLMHPDEVTAHLRTTNDDVLRRKIRWMDDKARVLLDLKLAPLGL